MIVGDIVAFSTRANVAEYEKRIMLSANPEYTSPLMVVIEKKTEKYDPKTGHKLGSPVQCIYYCSKNGKIERRWFSSSSLKPVKVDNLPILKVIDKKSYLKDKRLSEKQFQENILNIKVAIRTIDLELNKVKINKSLEDASLVETNHLDFLPPVMQVIGYKYLDEKRKFNEETGELLIELKCKWYNSTLKTFSEDFFPLSALYIIEEEELNERINQIESAISEEKYISINLAKVIELEGDEDTVVRKLIKPLDIAFHHYYYRLRYFDLNKQKNSSLNINCDDFKLEEANVFAEKFPNYKDGKIIQAYECTINTGEFYRIKYRDRFGSKTERIIRVRDIQFDINYTLDDFNQVFEESLSNENDMHKFILNNFKKYINDDGVEIYLESNCLLRNGEIRHFRLKGIYEIQKLNFSPFEKNEVKAPIVDSTEIKETALF